MSRSVRFVWAWQVKNAQKWFRQRGPKERKSDAFASACQSVSY